MTRDRRQVVWQSEISIVTCGPHAALARRFLHSRLDHVADGVAASRQTEQMIRLVESLADRPFRDTPLILGHALHRPPAGVRT